MRFIQDYYTNSTNDYILYRQIISQKLHFNYKSKLLMFER